MERREGSGKAGKRSPKPSTTMKNNLIMTGVAEDDNMSVMMGMMHSVSSQATAQINNTRMPISIGGGDDMSVMTGVSGAMGDWGCCY